MRLAAPGPITAPSARAAAHAELQKPAYQRAKPGWLDQLWQWIKDHFHFGGSGHAFSGGGAVGFVILLVVLLVLALLLVKRLGRLPSRDPERAKQGRSRRRTAQDYRDEAETYAAAGNFAEAVRATTRAMVRELEDRGVLEPTPGSTAAALSAQAAAAVPAVGPDAGVVAGTFDQVWYSGRPATADDARAVRDAELRISAARLVVTA